MYEFVRGPLVWIAFIGFFGGMAYQFITMARLARKDNGNRHCRYRLLGTTSAGLSPERFGTRCRRQTGS